MFQNTIKFWCAVAFCALSLSTYAVDFSGDYIATEKEFVGEPDYVYRVRAYDLAVDGALVLPKASEDDEFLNEKIWLMDVISQENKNLKPLVFREVLFEPDEWEKTVLSSNNCLVNQNIEESERTDEMMMFCLTQKNGMLKDKKLEDALLMVMMRFGSAKVVLKKLDAK